MMVLAGLVVFAALVSATLALMRIALRLGWQPRARRGPSFLGRFVRWRVASAVWWRLFH